MFWGRKGNIKKDKKSEKNNFNEKAKFEYVTFEKAVSFRGSNFPQGLAFEKANIADSVNFHGVSGLDPGNTQRETFRIIKHSFDKIGNYLEANKYYAKEMELIVKKLLSQKKL